MAVSENDREQMARQVALFSVLVHSRGTGRLAQALEVQAELAAEGIDVRFRRATRERRGANDATA